VHISGNHSPLAFRKLNVDHVTIHKCYLDHECFPLFSSIRQIDMDFIELCGQNKLPLYKNPQIVANARPLNIQYPQIGAENKNYNSVKICRILVSKGIYNGENRTGVCFNSNELESLEVLSAPGYKQQDEQTFRVLLIGSSLKKLILHVDGTADLHLTNSKCLSNLEKYYGNDPSKVQISYWDEDANSHKESTLQYVLPEGIEIHIINEAPDNIEEEFDNIDGESDITQEEVEQMLTVSDGEREERNQSHLLIEEQDRAYEAALQADQERKRKQEEERQRQVLEQAEAEIQEKARTQRLQEKHQEQLEKRRRMGTEPTPTEPDVCMIAFRLPNATRIERRFRTWDTLQLLYDFVETLEEMECIDAFDLFLSFPRQSYFNRKQNTLLEVGLVSSTVIHVEGQGSMMD